MRRAATRRRLLPLALVLAAATAAPGLAGCFSKAVGTWEFTPMGAVTEGTPVTELSPEEAQALPRSVVAALEAAARGERRMLELSEGEAASLRAVIPANPAVVRFEGRLVGVAQVSIAD